MGGGMRMWRGSRSWTGMRTCMDTNCFFRAGREAAFRGDGDLATRIMLDNTVMFGLENSRADCRRL